MRFELSWTAVNLLASLLSNIILKQIYPNQKKDIVQFTVKSMITDRKNDKQ